MSQPRPRDEALKRAIVSAPFALRCGAVLIDYVLIATIFAFTTVMARPFGGGTRTAGSTVETLGYLAAIVVAVFSFIVLAGLRGQTLGKWATGLQIARVSDGEPIGFGRAALRHLIGYALSFVTLGLGFLFAVFNPQGRGLHDFLAGTIVVRVRKRARTSSTTTQSRPVTVKS
jgi:uncharacterized RDD family membrane protein YckC